MRYLYHPLLVLIAMNAASIGRTDEPAVGSNRHPWTTLQWKMAAPSPFSRVESPTAVVNNKLYLFGGFTEDLGASTQVDVYDPVADLWSRKMEMPTGLTHLNPAIDGTTIWFAGGFKGKHPGPVTNEVWKYDVVSDTWTAGIPLPEPRAGGGLAVLGRQLHYFGGYKEDKWQVVGTMPEKLLAQSAEIISGRIVVTGGGLNNPRPLTATTWVAPLPVEK